ncbi:hypothetical protein ANTRET_LOCUS7656 [Anthophora retusa]
MSKEYTINELSEFLRARNLAVSGSKSELILRLEDFDSNIWNVIAIERGVAQESERQRRDGEEEEGTRQPLRDVRPMEEEM